MRLVDWLKAYRAARGGPKTLDAETLLWMFNRRLRPDYAAGVNDRLAVELDGHREAETLRVARERGWI